MRSIDLVEKGASVYKTFNDYQNEFNAELIEVLVKSDSPWKDKTLMEANIPEDILIVMIKRSNKITTPKGSTVIKPGDIMVLTNNGSHIGYGV